MRISRIPIAAALTVLTLLVFAAANAHATISPTVTVSNEVIQTECPAITSPTVAEEDHAPGTVGSVTGGCVIDFGGEVRLYRHILGFEIDISDCYIDSLEFHVNGEGEGWADSLSVSRHIPANDCPVTACADDLGRMELWPGHFDLVSPGEFVLVIELCVNDASADRECEVVLDIDESPEHDYFNAQDHVNGVDHGNASDCEVDSILFIAPAAGNHTVVELVGGHS